MGINIRQEGKSYSDNKWIVEIKEKWHVFDDKEEAELLAFLRVHWIPYTTGYCFEGIVISLDVQKLEITKFDDMRLVVTKLLSFKNQFVNPKPEDLTPLVLGKDTEIKVASVEDIANPTINKPKIFKEWEK